MHTRSRNTENIALSLTEATCKLSMRTNNKTLWMQSRNEMNNETNRCNRDVISISKATRNVCRLCMSIIQLRDSNTNNPMTTHLIEWAQFSYGFPFCVIDQRQKRLLVRCWHVQLHPDRLKMIFRRQCKWTRSMHWTSFQQYFIHDYSRASFKVNETKPKTNEL